MKYRVLVAAFSCWLLSGCTVIEKWKHSEGSNDKAVEIAEYCVVEEQTSDVPNNCDLRYWLAYWIENDQLRWSQRRDKINQLGETPADTFKKILLSQSKGTPYQARLRAQGWADQLLPELSEPMRNLIKVLVYNPSQELLEFESALIILTRINTNQSKELDAQTDRLQEQQQQIEQLLKIEASMMQQTETSDSNERNN